MQLAKIVNKLNAKDVEICKMFKAVVLEGKFEIQGRALTKVGSLLQWFDELDQRIAETIKEPPPEVVRKEVGFSEEVKEKKKNK
jgi:hypothetical protein